MWNRFGWCRHRCGATAWATLAALLALTFVRGWGARVDAEVAGARRPPFLARLPAPLNQARWREIGPIRRAPEMRVTPTPEGMVSADGRYVIHLGPLYPSEHDYDYRAIVMDLEKRTTQVLTLDGDLLFAPDSAYWDPLNPAFIYVDGMRYPKGWKEGDRAPRRRAWHVRFDGTHASPASKPEENVSLGPPFPDGRVLIGVVGSKESPVIQEGVDYSTRRPMPADWWAAPAVGWPSPNGELLAGSVSFAWAALDIKGIVGPVFAQGNISVYDTVAKRLSVLFTESQVSRNFPPNMDISSGRILPPWLPDSSGLLVSVQGRGRDFDHPKEKLQLWEVTLDGEARKVADGVRVAGYSANGRQWIFNEGKKYYLVSVPAGVTPRQGRRPR